MAPSEKSKADPLYHTKRTFQSMRSRCNNPNNTSYLYYGGKGIKVCARWSTFVNFLEDMGPRPSETTIDRIDGTGNYEPDNCRWATKKEQCDNRSNTVWLEYKGERKTMADWSRAIGLPAATIAYRLKKGMDLDEVFAPVKTENLRPGGGQFRMLEFRGEVKSLHGWADALDIAYPTLWRRLYDVGMSVEEAFTTPVRFQKPY